MNEVLKTIAQRYSCRDYTGEMPPREQLDAIALAAVQAPSAMNKQPWQVVVIANKTIVDELDDEGMRILSEMEDKGMYERIMGRGGKLFYNAPCMFLIPQQPGAGLDTGIVAQNIALAAASLGLGSVICGMGAIPFSGVNAAKLKEKAHLPQGWEFGMSVLVGKAAGAPNAPHTPDTAKIHFVE